MNKAVAKINDESLIKIFNRLGIELSPIEINNRNGGGFIASFKRKDEKEELNTYTENNYISKDYREILYRTADIAVSFLFDYDKINDDVKNFILDRCYKLENCIICFS